MERSSIGDAYAQTVQSLRILSPRCIAPAPTEGRDSNRIFVTNIAEWEKIARRMESFLERFGLRRRWWK